MQIKLMMKVVALATVVGSLAGCAGPNSSNAHTMRATEVSAVNFQTLSKEDLKLVFLANTYYSPSKSQHNQALIAESVFPDLSKEAYARRNAKIGLATLNAETTREFERRLAPQLNTYMGKTFRVRLQEKGVIDARITGSPKGLSIKTNVFPHPFLQEMYRPFGIAPSQYSGRLEQVGGPTSRQSISYAPMTVSVKFPFSLNEYQKLVYDTQRAGRRDIHFSMDFTVDFALDCASSCDFRVLDTELITYSLK